MPDLKLKTGRFDSTTFSDDLRKSGGTYIYMKSDDIFSENFSLHPVPPADRQHERPVGDSPVKERSFSERHFKQLREFEDTHFWFGYRNDLIAWALKRFFGSVHNFLEIGCGNGFVSAHLEKLFPSTHFIGVDLFTEGLSFAKQRLRRTSLALMDLRRPAFKSAFEAVGLFDVLEHISDDRTALKNLHDMMKPRGHLIITVPQHQWMWSESDKIACHKRRYSRKELSDKLSEAGFEVVYVTSFISMLLPFLVFSRKLLTLSAIKTDINELNISPAVNRVCGMICNLEGMILKKGFPAPFGGSILAVGIRP